MVFKICKSCGYIIAVKEEETKAYCNRCKEKRELKEREATNDSKIRTNKEPRQNN